MLWPNNIIDMVFYLLRLKWLVLFIFLAIVSNLVICAFCRTSLQHYSIWQKFLPSLLIVVISIIVIIFTARNDLLLTLLGSEDDALAEQAYFLYKRTASIPDMVSLIAAGKEADNVRFYLARMLGEILSSHSPEDVEAILNKIDQTPLIDPKFIGQNQLNQDASTFDSPMSPILIVRYYYQAR